MRASMIVALSNNGVIGREGDLPWRLSADLQRFKATTMGHCLIMGRKTFASIGRPLPGRTSIVLSRQSEVELPDGVRLAHDWESAAQLVGEREEAFVIGGGQIYELSMPHVDRIYMTRVDATVDGDVHFPSWQPEHWRLIRRDSHPADERNDYAQTFEVYDRRS